MGGFNFRVKEIGMGRREAREKAFLFLFGNIFTNYSLAEIIEHCKDQDETDVQTDCFTIEIFKGVKENMSQIDKIISDTSVKWSKERLSKIALTILRVAIYEMIFRDDIPVSVSVNEAVELAKKYGTSEEAAFVNGILGTVSQKVEKKDE